MEDGRRVCSMCGDIGFPDKIFQCLRCLHRFQHSYCSNYYCDDSTDSSAGVCDWCRNDDHCRTRPRRNPAGSHRDKPPNQTSDHDESSGGGTRRRDSAAPSSSAKHAGRRYKLLKDVLC